MGRIYEATTEGQRAGQLGLPASLCPYPFNSPEYAEWMRTWRNAQAAQLQRVAALARMVA